MKEINNLIECKDKKMHQQHSNTNNQRYLDKNCFYV